VLSFPETSKINPEPLEKDYPPAARWCEAEYPAEWGALPEWKFSGPNLPKHFVAGPEGEPVPDPRLLAVMGPHIETPVNQGKPLIGDTNAQETIAKYGGAPAVGLPNLNPPLGK
jgi:hypothetical protein